MFAARVVVARPAVDRAFAFKLGWKLLEERSLLFFAAPWKQLAEPERWRFVGASFLERPGPVGGFADWGLVWIVGFAALLATLFFRGYRRPETAFLLAAVACCWLGVVRDLRRHTARRGLARPDRSDRLMIQLLPLT
ncbi:MAG: hypothetical protein R2991_06295 [Thermoanaerobaculia bacterium]